MPGWLKTNSKVRVRLEVLSWDATCVWGCVRLYMADVGNDGVMPKGELLAACQRKTTLARAEKGMAECVAARLFIDHGDRWEDSDWKEDQPPKEVWEDDIQRERWQRAKALSRNTALCTMIRQRDRNLCRYCGIRVNWADKRGPTGGTYDHIDPDGDNSMENVVVACRRCNGIKRDRTPDQAGMSLLRAGVMASPGAASDGHTDPQLFDPAKSKTWPGQIRAKSGPNPIQPESRAPARDRTGSNRAKSGPNTGQIKDLAGSNRNGSHPADITPAHDPDRATSETRPNTRFNGGN